MEEGERADAVLDSRVHDLASQTMEATRRLSQELADEQEPDQQGKAGAAGSGDHVEAASPEEWRMELLVSMPHTPE